MPSPSAKNAMRAPSSLVMTACTCSSLIIAPDLEIVGARETSLDDGSGESALNVGVEAQPLRRDGHRPGQGALHVDAKACDARDLDNRFVDQLLDR